MAEPGSVGRVELSRGPCIFLAIFHAMTMSVLQGKVSRYTVRCGQATSNLLHQHLAAIGYMDWRSSNRYGKKISFCLHRSESQ
jgi:hypothetical protein